VEGTGLRAGKVTETAKVFHRISGDVAHIGEGDGRGSRGEKFHRVGVGVSVG